jgi:ribonuclease HII
MQRQDEFTIGIDEAGRGSLAFDVVAAAVIMPPDLDDPLMSCIKDSKKMTKKARQRIAEFIKANALTYGIGTASPEEIDNVNILQANYMAMHRALDNAIAKYTEQNIQKILVDGNCFKQYKGIPYECIVKGDDKMLNIAAASILAKTHHDDTIHDLISSNTNDFVDHWDFKNNVGYGTKKHKMGIAQHGLSPWHRKTFIH